MKLKKGIKQKLSENFHSGEFDCKCKGYCNETTIDENLVKILQNIRDRFGRAVTINSAYRCEKHNKAVGGASGSRHKTGDAADIVVKGISPLEVAKYAEHLGVLGIGHYSTFVHVDTRTVKSFWYSHSQLRRTTFGGKNPYSYSGANVKQGSKGTDVKWLQWALKFWGFDCGSIDGSFGEKTKYALLKFQEAKGLKTDAVCGKLTSAALKGI